MTLMTLMTINELIRNRELLETLGWWSLTRRLTRVNCHGTIY